MDRTAVLALRELYRRIPKIQCKRLCGHSCRTLIDMSDTERDRIEAYTGQRLPEWMRTVRNRVCPLLSPTGECTIYGLRPTICRIWGVTDTPGLRCPHGCAIEGEPLTAVQTQQLVLETLRVGGSRYSDEDIATLKAMVADSDELGPLIAKYVDGDHSPEVLDALRAQVRAWAAAKAPDEH